MCTVLEKTIERYPYAQFPKPRFDNFKEMIIGTACCIKTNDQRFNLVKLVGLEKLMKIYFGAKTVIEQAQYKPQKFIDIQYKSPFSA